MANSMSMIGPTVVGFEPSIIVIGIAKHLWQNRRKIVSALICFYGPSAKK